MSLLVQTLLLLRAMIDELRLADGRRINHCCCCSVGGGDTFLLSKSCTVSSSSHRSSSKEEAGADIFRPIFLPSNCVYYHHQCSVSIPRTSFVLYFFPFLLIFPFASLSQLHFPVGGIIALCRLMDGAGGTSV